MSDKPRRVAVGDAALLIEFGDTIDPLSGRRVRSLARHLAAVGLAGLSEIVPTYRSLLLRFDPEELERVDLAREVERGLLLPVPEEEPGRHWRVPVVYGGAFGVDLEDFAAFHGMSASALIDRHVRGKYRVAMIGFQPGFAYLSGLPPALARSRREEPRMRTPAGSVSVGGIQAAVASVEAPSGWHLLGRTPARLFMPGRDPSFLLQAGDTVSFEPVAPEAWPELDARAAAGELVAERLQ